MSTQIECTAWIRPSAPRSGLIQTLTQSALPSRAAHLQLRAGDLLAGEAGADRFLGPGPPGRRLGEQRQHGLAHQLGRRMPEQLRGAVIDAQEPSIEADRHVGVGCLFIEVPVAPLALDELLLDPQPLELDGGPGGEDPEDEQPAGLGRHGPLVADRQVAEHLAVAVEQRHAQVALDPQVDRAPGRAGTSPGPPADGGRAPRAPRPRRGSRPGRTRCSPRSAPGPSRRGCGPASRRRRTRRRRHTRPRSPRPGAATSDWKKASPVLPAVPSTIARRAAISSPSAAGAPLPDA